MLCNKDTRQSTVGVGTGKYLVVDHMDIVETAYLDTGGHEVGNRVVVDIESVREASGTTYTADSAVAAVNMRVGDIHRMYLVANEHTGGVLVVETTLGDNLDAVKTYLCGIRNRDDIVVVASSTAGKLDTLE